MLQRSRISTDDLDGAIRVVTLVGEHDLSTRQDVLAELERVRIAGASVIVDLSEADFIDSSVLSALVAAQRRAEWTPGRRFGVVVPARGAARRLFDLTDVGSVFATFASRSDAIDWFQPTSGREIG